MQKVTDIERDLQTMDILVLIGGDEVVMNNRLLSTRFSLYNGAQEKTMDSASFFVMVDSALLCIFTK